MKKITATLPACAAAVQAFSQTSGNTAGSFPDNPNLALYITAAAIVALLIAVLIIAVYIIRVLRFLTEDAARQNAARAGATYVPPVSWWQRIVTKLNASVPVEQEKEIEMDHNYDGIRELDNHLPPWWKWLFYGTIAWSVIYLVAFHITESLPLSEAEYSREVAMAEESVRRYQASQPRTVIDENTLEYKHDPRAIENGRHIFISNNCGGCHRNDGGGSTIGPNLADEYWLHGGEVGNVFRTIRDGVVEKGMPAWGKAMSASDVRDVAFFVMSLQGTNPPDQKAPQGTLFKQKAEADSLTRAGL